MSFEMQVAGISYGERIGDEYTCKGKNISPHIKWKDPPASTKEMVIFVDDHDAPSNSFNHWTIRGIQSSISEIHEDVKEGEKTEEGWIQLKNDYDKRCYSGPCPKGTKEHRYFVTIYALVRPLEESEASDRETMRKICEKLMIKKVTWMFKYGKQ